MFLCCFCLFDNSPKWSGMEQHFQRRTISPLFLVNLTLPVTAMNLTPTGLLAPYVFIICLRIPFSQEKCPTSTWPNCPRGLPIGSSIQQRHCLVEACRRGRHGNSHPGLFGLCWCWLHWPERESLWWAEHHKTWHSPSDQDGAPPPPAPPPTRWPCSRWSSPSSQTRSARPRRATRSRTRTRTLASASRIRPAMRGASQSRCFVLGPMGRTAVRQV